MNEKNDYLIGTGILALAEANHPEFATVIHDLSGSYYSRKSAIHLLNEACMLKGGSDYLGRLRAIRETLEYPKKTPLIISLQELIYGFPTKSPTQFDCRWIFPRHIKQFVVENGDYYVIFKNGLKFQVNCSARSFKTQLERSSLCMLHYMNLHPIQIHLNISLY